MWFYLFVSGPPLLVTGTPLAPSAFADPRFSMLGPFFSFPKSPATPLDALGACVKLYELSRVFRRVGGATPPFAFAALPPIAFSLPLATDILSVPFFSPVACFLAVACGCAEVVAFAPVPPPYVCGLDRANPSLLEPWELVSLAAPSFFSVPPYAFAYPGLLVLCVALVLLAP